MSDLPAAPAVAGATEPLPRSRVELSQGNHVVAVLLFVVTLVYVFGFPLFVLAQRLRGEALGNPAFSVGAVVASLVLNVVVMGLGAVAILALLTGGGGALRHRLLLDPGASHGRAAGLGIGVTIAALLLYALVLVAVDRFVDIAENEVVLELAEDLTWPLIVLIAVASSVSEELYFRALLQPQIGLVASSLLFGLVHVTYGQWLQVVVPAALGFVFGWLLLRTRSLAAPIAGHFVWNFLQLAGAMLFADEASAPAWLR